MRSISATLLAAQKGASGVPYVRCVAKNNIRGMRHLVFAQEYADGLGDEEHDAAADGTYLHRARVNGSQARYQRDPSASWTALGSTGANLVAIAATGTRVIVVYNVGNSLYFRESTDAGGSFGSETLIVSVGAVTKALAVEYKNASGDLVVVYEQSNQLRRIRRTGGSWGSSAAWTLSANSINGADVVYNADFTVAVSGVDTNGRPTVWTCQLGDGVLLAADTWAQQYIVVQAESDASVTFQAPHVCRVGSDGSLRMTYVEKFTGTPSYTRTFLTVRQPSSLNPIASWEWLDPVPLNNTTEKGLAITGGRNPEQALLSRPALVLAAPAVESALDMSGDLLEATIAERDGIRTGCELVFDNSAGQYAGPPAPVALHRDVEVGLGYDGEYSPVAGQSIVGWEYRREGGVSRFVVRTQGNAYWLARSRPRTTIALSAVTATDVTRGAASRAGLGYSAIGASARSSTFSLDWVIHPHQHSLEALEAVGELLSDVFLSVGGQHRVVIHNPQAGDSVDYAFGADHAVYRSRTRGDEAASFAEVAGEGVLGQAIDFLVMANDKPIQDRPRDPHATTSTPANDHAAARLRKSQLAKDLGEIVVPPSCGLEIADVVSYADDLASASSITARVRSIVTAFRRAGPGRTPVYEQTIGLGGL